MQLFFVAVVLSIFLILIDFVAALILFTKVSVEAKLARSLSNLWKTVFTKSFSKGLAATSFASLYLRTHPLLTFIKRSKFKYIFFVFL